MQAGLADRKLRSRDVFTAVGNFFPSAALLMRVRCRPQAVIPLFGSGTVTVTEGSTT